MIFNTDFHTYFRFCEVKKLWLHYKLKILFTERIFHLIKRKITKGNKCLSIFKTQKLILIWTTVWHNWLITEKIIQILNWSFIDVINGLYLSILLMFIYICLSFVIGGKQLWQDKLFSLMAQKFVNGIKKKKHF